MGTLIEFREVCKYYQMGDILTTSISAATSACLSVAMVWVSSCIIL